MKWLEISIPVAAEAAEAVSETLSRYVPQGVAIDLGNDPTSQDVTIRAYLDQDSETLEETRQKIEEAIWHLSQIWPMPQPTYQTIADQDWTARWKKNIPILHMGTHIIIKPLWRDYDTHENDIVLEMDPGLAFGTGLHPTTQLCMEALEDLIQPGMHILDLGTGTGILAIAAAKLGAGEIAAIDNDSNAVKATRHNARNNQVADKLDIIHGSLSEAKDAYDLVLANILAPIITKMAQEGLAARLKQDGRLVASGILAEQVDEVSATLKQNGLTVTDIRKKEDWIALIATRAETPL